jgi:hypothetical protein
MMFGSGKACHDQGGGGDPASKAMRIGAPYIVLDQIDSVRQFVAARLSPWKVRHERISTHLDSGYQAIGNLAALDVCDERIDSPLPFRLRHAGGNAFVGDDARIVLRQ